MYIESASHSDQAACVASLVAKSEEARTHYGYSDEDARSVALNNLRSVAYATQMTLNLLDSWCIGDEAIRTVIPQLLGLTGVTDHSVKVAGNALHKNTKLSLALLGQFQIENCLRNLAREISPDQPPPKAFFSLARSLIENLGLPESLVADLNVAALIRNSLHGNGIHSGHQGLDTVTTLEQVTYEFQHQQRVSCATVEHIAHALESSIDILATIFRTPEVGALEDPVMDQYAWEIATDP